MKILFKICLLSLTFTSLAFTQTVTMLPKDDSASDEVTFVAIEHASFIIQSALATIYVDPVGELSAYENFKRPDIILITHGHRDHLNKNLIWQLRKENTIVLTPKPIIDELTFGEGMANGDKKTLGSITIEALPMYNTTQERLQFREKDVGNGYLVTLSGKRIYISGDTEDIPEMRALKNIDYAFICMNLPYTMTIEQAASAVLAFKPKVVFPYHYRGMDGMSDIEAFKKAVSVDPEIAVRFLKWY